MLDVPELGAFEIPRALESAHITYVPEFGKVVEKIAAVIPSRDVLFLFSSKPNIYHGGVTFPYFNLDKGLMSCDLHMRLADSSLAMGETNAFLNEYFTAVRIAASAVLWVEVGHECVENVFQNEKEQTCYIETINNFRNFRANYPDQAANDLFSQYNLESLLNSL